MASTGLLQDLESELSDLDRGISVDDNSRRLQIYSSFLESIRPTLQHVGRLKSTVGRLKASLDASYTRIDSQIACAKQLAVRLEEHNRRVAEKCRAVEQARIALEKSMLSEVEKEQIKGLNINSSHTDLLSSVGRLMEVRSISANPELANLFDSTTDVVSEWFDRNISTVRLDMVSPSLNTIVSYMVAMKGSSAFLAHLCDRRAPVKYRHFLDALTTGVRAKPIEMHAYSPLRYISDMLAWIHEAFANELDLIDTLTEAEDIGMTEKKAAGVRCLARVGEELKVRSTAALQRIGSVAAGYNVAMLFGYYLEWFQGQVEASVLTDTLSELYGMCWEHLEAMMTEIRSDPPEPIDPKTLQPSPQILAILSEAQELELVHRTGLLPSDADASFAKTKRSLDEVLLHLLRGSNEYEQSVLLLNTLARLKDLDSFLQAAHDDAVAKVSGHLVGALYEKALLGEESDAAEVVRNLGELFVVHSGWDWFKSEPRVSSLTDRKAIASLCIDTVLERYTHAYGTLVECKVHKSPATIRTLLS